MSVFVTGGGGVPQKIVSCQLWLTKSQPKIICANCANPKLPNRFSNGRGPM